MLGRSLFIAIFTALITIGLWSSDAVAASNPCNPCAVNPCAANPCATNPCAANPCDTVGGNMAIRADRVKDEAAVLAEGAALWSDASLGRSGLSCATCHPKGKDLHAAPYPKYIAMADDVVTLDQMINFCMKNPMGGDYLKWNSREMTALAAYVSAHSGGNANPCASNPCAMNPCSKNPCAANPCAANPCSKNPCNPCAAKKSWNPCNPCGY